MMRKSHSAAAIVSLWYLRIKRTKRAESVIKSVTTDIKLEIKWTQLDRNQTKLSGIDTRAHTHTLILTSVFDFHTRANRKFIYPSHNHLIFLHSSSPSLTVCACGALPFAHHCTQLLISWHFNALSIDLLTVDFSNKIRIRNGCVYGFQDKIAKSVRLNGFQKEEKEKN